MRKVNRRSFIKGAALLSGAAICSATGVSKAIASETAPEQTQTPPPLPWGYQELDPEYVRKLGHLGYYLEECGGGAFWAIMTALKEKVGYPYTNIPLPSKEDFLAHLSGDKKEHLQCPMQYGVGGVSNFGSLCGAPNGSASAITYAIDIEGANKIIPRLLRYYESESFPTEKSNRYAEGHEMLVPKYKTDKALPQSSSQSVLCHVSVGKWCEKSGYASGAKERSERCGRLTGDIAAMAVTLMNAYHRGELEAAFPMKYSHETAECRTCHSKGEKYESGQFTRGAMECAPCHDEKMVPHKGANTLKTAYGANVGTWAGAAVVGTVTGIGVHAASKRLGKGDGDDEH